MRINKYILVIILLSTLELYSQFKVVQTDPRNYSYDPVTKIHKLTDGTNRMQATAIWNDTSFPGYEKIDLNEDFIVEAEMYFGFKDKEGADGIAFVLQSQGDKAIGSLGVGMGFAMNPYDGNKRVYPSFGVEIDTWFNSPASPPPVDRLDADHISYVINGDMYNLLGDDEFAKYDYNEHKDKDIEDGKFHCVKFHWDSKLEILSVYFDGQLRKSDNLTNGLGMKLSQLLGTNKVWWGFTTGTATKDNVHMLIFKKILRDKDVDITNINTNTSTLIGEFCEKTVSPCDNNINFSLDETGLKIVSVNWTLEPPIYDNVKFSNNKHTITDIITNDKKYYVEVTYEDGTKAKDSVFAKYLSLEVLMPDTVRICRNGVTNIKGDLKVNGIIDGDNSKILWNWRPKGIFSNIKDNIATISKNIPDTTISCDIVYQVSDSVTKCVLSKEVVLINLEDSFVFNIETKPCSGESSIVLVDENGKRFKESDFESIDWNFNSKELDKSNIIKFDSVLVNDDGLLVVKIKTNGGCLYTVSQVIKNNRSNNGNRILPDIGTNYCDRDTFNLTALRDFDYYEWSTGSHNKSIEISKSGLYWLFVVDSVTNCEFYDSLYVQFHEKPTYKIENKDIILCNDETKTIRLQTSDSNTVMWYDENGNIISKTKDLTSVETGKYYAVITNYFGCSDTTELVNIRRGNWTQIYKLYSENNSDQINFENTHTNKTYFKNFIIENLIDSTYSINFLKMKNKLIFSIPSSQFPVLLKPFQKDTLNVVMNSKNTGYFEDFIYSEDDCENEKIHIFTEIEKIDLNITDRCGINWQLKSGNLISLSAPYPNPTNNKITIDISTSNSKISPKDLKVYLFDSRGNIIDLKCIVKRVSTNNYNINFDLNNMHLRSGVYFINIGLENENKTIPIFYIE